MAKDGLERLPWEPKAGAGLPSDGRVGWRRLSGVPEWLRSALFLRSSSERLGWRKVLLGEGIDPDAREQAVLDTSTGAAILRNFEARIVGG